MESYKIPPQDIEIEKVILGAVMLNREAYPTVSGIITEDSFYNPANATIFRCFKNLYEKNSPIDLMTVKSELERMKALSEAGGIMYLAKLTGNVSSSSNIEHHAMIIQQKHIQRKLIFAGNEIVKMAFDESVDIADILDLSDKLIQEASSNAFLSANLKTLASQLGASITSAQEREIRAKKGLISGVPSGLKDLDRMTGGFRNGDMIVLAARPSMGKSALMLHMAKYAAKKGSAVCLFSLEMSATSLADRIIVGEANIDSDNFRSGYISADDWSRIDGTMPETSKLPIYIDDNSGVSIRYIYNTAKKAQKQGNCDMVMIDYLGLADVADGNKNREQEISQATRAVKNMAKKLNIPVILLAQLNRENERRNNKEPILSDLKDSGAIEADADVVLFIHRPEYYGMAEDVDGESLKGVGKLIVAKHRQGPVGAVKFRYNESLTQIYDFEREREIPPSFYEPTQTLEPNTSFDLPF